MILQLPLCDPQYRSRSVYNPSSGGSTQYLYNLYPERVPNMPGKSAYVLIGTPGLNLLGTTANNLACRGAHKTGTGRVFSVHGAVLYETSGGTATSRGSISTTTGHVSMTDDGVCLTIADGTLGYTLTLASNTLASIPDANFPDNSVSVTAQDGYTIAAKKDTGEFYLSQLLDATDWTPIQFATAEYRADYLMGLASAAGQLYLLGAKSSEVHYNTGNPDFPFERINGAIFDIGCTSAATIAVLNSTVFFLGNAGAVWAFQGTTPKRISHPSLEEQIATHTVSTCFAFAYESEGHQFYVLTFPTNGATYVYDLSEEAWHQRGSDNSYWTVRAVIDGTAFSADNGKIASMPNNVSQEFGVSQARRVNVGPVQHGRKRLFHSRFRFDMDALLDSGTTLSQAVTLYQSDIGGLSFPVSYSKTKTITTLQRNQYEFHRLGSSAERWYRLEFTGAFRPIIKGAEVEITEGRF